MKSQVKDRELKVQAGGSARGGGGGGGGGTAEGKAVFCHHIQKTKRKKRNIVGSMERRLKPSETGPWSPTTPYLPCRIDNVDG